jgi:hypothetical protein
MSDELRARAQLFIGKSEMIENVLYRWEMTHGGAHGVVQEEGAERRMYMKEV